jgi:hypothetical protein
MSLSKKKRKVLEELSYEDRMKVRDFYDECFRNLKANIYDNGLSLDDLDYYLTVKCEETEEEVERVWHGKDFWNFCMDLFSAISKINKKRDRN